MAEKILELQIGDQIIQVPVKPDDTPEALSKVLSDNGFDPSKYTNEINSALSQNETSDIGHELAGFSPEEKAGLKTALAAAYEAGDKKEIDRISGLINAMKNLYPGEKPLTQAQLKDKAKESISKDISNIFDLLPEIETYKGWKSLPAAGVQKAGAFVGENPEYSQYIQKLKQLKIPVIKQVQGDVGAVSDTQERSALDYFPYSSDTLFEEKGRPRAIVNLLQSVKAGTGVDLQEMVTPEQMSKAAGPDPEGYLKSYLAKMLNKNKPQQDQVIDLNQFVK
jgi:hypothetical protein